MTEGVQANPNAAQEALPEELPEALPGPTFKWIYHLSRVIFGGWFVYSGVMPFIEPSWQPLGQEPAAIDFSLALISSGLMNVVKVFEIVLGLCILANRGMPWTLVLLAPINGVIVYWNLVLDEGMVEYTFGALTIAFNVILAWPWRRYFWQLFTWRGHPDYSMKAYWPGSDTLDDQPVDERSV